MAGLLAKLSVKPLLWACGLLLAGCAVLGGLLYTARADVAAARAETDAAAATVGQRTTEREAWKQAARASQAAAGRWEAAFADMQILLRDAQGEARRLDAAGRQAVAAAQAREAEANRTLEAWMRRYAEQVRVGDCAAALNAVQAACPAFEGF